MRNTYSSDWPRHLTSLTPGVALRAVRIVRVRKDSEPIDRELLSRGYMVCGHINRGLIVCSQLVTLL